MVKHVRDVYLTGPTGQLLNHFLAAYGAATTDELRSNLTSAFLENDRKTIDEILPSVCEPDFDALSVLVTRCYNNVPKGNIVKELELYFPGVPLGPGGYKDESGELRRVVSPGDVSAKRNRINVNDSVDDLLRKLFAAYGQPSGASAGSFIAFAMMQNFAKMREHIPALSTTDFDAVMHYARCVNQASSHDYAIRSTLALYPTMPYGPDEPATTATRAEVVPLKAVRREIPELADEQVARLEDPLVKHFVSQMDLLCVSADTLVLAEKMVKADQTVATDAVETAAALRQTTQKLFCGVLNALSRVCESSQGDSPYLKLIANSTIALARLAPLLLPAKAPAKDAAVKG